MALIANMTGNGQYSGEARIFASAEGAKVRRVFWRINLSGKRTEHCYYAFFGRLFAIVFRSAACFAALFFNGYIAFFAVLPK